MFPAKRDARIAGWLYFLFAALGPFCLMYVPNKIMVRGGEPAIGDWQEGYWRLTKTKLHPVAIARGTDKQPLQQQNKRSFPPRRTQDATRNWRLAKAKLRVE